MDKVTEIRLNRLDENQKTTTTWLEGLDNRIAEIGRDIVEIRTANQPRDLPWAVRFLLLPLAVAAAVATVGAVIHLEIVVGGIETSIHNNVQSIGELQRIQTQAALDQAEQDAKAGDKSAAKQRVDQATELMGKLKSVPVSAPPSFFESAVNTLDHLKFAGLSDTDTHEVSLKLADYRSALNPPPRIPERREKFESIKVTVSGVTYDRFAHSVIMPGCGQVEAQGRPCTGFTILLDGRAINATGMPPGEDLFVTASNSVEKNQDVIRGGIFIGSSQTLDGIEWQNVTFVGTKIKYTGGSTKLENVTFVNCIFDLLPSTNGIRLANYAALDNKQKLTLPSS